MVICAYQRIIENIIPKYQEFPSLDNRIKRKLISYGKIRPIQYFSYLSYKKGIRWLIFIAKRKGINENILKRRY
ncbi:MAG: hypothetical protein ABIK77_08190 [candidate division WOR-3 bacterium]